MKKLQTLKNPKVHRFFKGGVARKILLACLTCFLFGCGGGGGGDSSSNGDPCLLGSTQLVFGGQQCDFRRSPVVAIVAYSSSNQIIGICSGSLITLQHVLTAAHCAELAQLPGFAGAVVYADEAAQPITHFVRHPLYDGSVGSPFDVAVLTIAQALDIGPLPIVVSSSLEVGEQIIVYGYGRNEQNSTGRPTASDFKGGFMRVGIIGGGNFGAAFDDSGSAICQGDSGGPAVKTVGGVAGIVGVTSFTFNGCQSGSVSGFVDVQNPRVSSFILANAPSASTL